MSYDRRMITCSELAKRLKEANVQELAKAAGVSTKTLYRLRHQKNSPTLDTAARIVAALDAMKKSAAA